MRDSEYRKAPEEVVEKLSREDQETRDDLLYLLSIMEKQGVVGVTQLVDYQSAQRYKDRLSEYLEQETPEGSATVLFDEIIFDFDGVLYDSMYSVFKSVERMLEEKADMSLMDGVSIEEAARKFASPFQIFYKRFGIEIPNEEARKKFFHDFQHIQAEVNNSHHTPATLFPEAKAVLRKLEEAKRANPRLKIHIISSGKEDHVRAPLIEQNLEDIFDQIHAECHDKTEQIRAIAKESGDPSRTVMIGDLPSDIKDAQSVSGVRTIAIARTELEQKRLGEFLPDYVIGSLEDLFALKPHNKELAIKKLAV